MGLDLTTLRSRPESKSRVHAYPTAPPGAPMLCVEVAFLSWASHCFKKWNDLGLHGPKWSQALGMCRAGRQGAVHGGAPSPEPVRGPQRLKEGMGTWGTCGQPL